MNHRGLCFAVALVAGAAWSQQQPVHRYAAGGLLRDDAQKLPFIAAEPSFASGAGLSTGRLHDFAMAAAGRALTGWSAR